MNARNRDVAHLERPQRWQQPFGPDMSEADVERVLATPPFDAMDADRFPASTPLNDILRYDARVLIAREGEIIVREGDYGNSAFVVLAGRARVILGDGLPAALLGRSQPRRRNVVEALAQLWTNSRIPERRQLSRYADVELGREADPAARVVLRNPARLFEQHKTAPIEAGQMFGELAALGRIPRAATVVAESESRILEIRWQGLREISRFDTAFRQRVESLYRQNALRHYLEETDLFRGVSPDDFDEVVRQTLFETYGSFDWHVGFKRNTGNEPVIAREGDYPDGLLLIRAGFARVSVGYGAGRRTLTYLSAGDYYGLHEILEQSRGSETTLETTLTALGYVDVLRIPAPILEKHVFPAMTAAPAQRLIDHARRPLSLDRGEEWLVEHRYINATQAMLIDLDRCVRCDDCVRACASTHDGNPRFKRHGRTFDHWMVANACMHCIDPVCMIGCPTGAIHRSEQGGTVVINDDTCIGCGTCAASCPYDNITLVAINDPRGRPVMDPQSHKPIMKATKCDLCANNPGGPACVRACPHDALSRVDFDMVNPIAALPSSYAARAAAS